MLAFAVRRIISGLVVLLVASFVVFALVHVIPGDPVTLYLTESAINPEAEAALRDQLNLDDPLVVRYGKWLASAITGDLGTSFRSHRPVTDVLLDALPATLQLAAFSMLIALLIGIPAGIISAVHRNGWADLAARWIALTGVAIPHFWLGLLLIYVGAYRLGWFPATGYQPFFDDPSGAIRATLLPAFTLGTGLAATLFRQMRGALLETLNQDYIRTARSKGLSERVVIIRHAVRNALLPVVTIIGMYSGLLIGGAVVTERVFAYPGIGNQAVTAIHFRDIEILQGVILVSVAAVLFTNTLADLAYARLNPRIRVS